MEIIFPEGSLINTKVNNEHLSTLETLKNAYTEGAVLEQTALMFDKNKNLILQLGQIKGIMPYYECAAGVREGTTRDISIISRVGKPVCFVITGFSTDSSNNPVAILSRRKVQQHCIDTYISSLVPGDIIDCRVIHVERFGCFVDVSCGIPALLPIDAISVSRINHPRDRIAVGMNLKCVVKNIDEIGRLLLSHKELLGTWEENAAGFSPGETVIGTVRSIEEYGLFIELKPNLAGLADRVDGIEISQNVSVFIKSIIPERMKIKLVIIDLLPANNTPPEPFYYFISEGRIDSFTYSPKSSPKIIETVF